MHTIEVMCLYIRAVRTSNWALYLSALEEFVRYFFALDKLNYARMILLYLAEMSQVEGTYSDISSEFSKGNLVVNKNTIPFCAVGPDHALEQINRHPILCCRTRSCFGTNQQKDESVWSPCWHNTELKMQEIVSSWSQPVLYSWQKKPREWLEIQRQQENATMSCHRLFWKGKQRMLKSLSFSYQENDIINLVTKGNQSC